MVQMREVYNFSPSKRAFQTQFKRWGFPSKQNPAHKNADLVTRVRELWEQNYSQRDMLSTLNEEGFDIKARELMRVRAKNRWLLRIPNGAKHTSSGPENPSPLESPLLDGHGAPGEGVVVGSDATSPEASAEGPADVLRKRTERLAQLQAKSDEAWATKKRRRRTKSYAGLLPADPPGPPRFPSETTLEESKQILSLDTKQYRALREQFQTVCEEESILKKTLAGTDKWQAVKDRIIRENGPLQSAFATTDDTNRQSKELALDVICTDVTKRMRTIGRRMTIVDAKNTLGINPEQSRQIREGFYTILQSAHFRSKVEMGAEQWATFKDQWISKTPVLQEMLASGDADPELATKKMALEVLCRDVMKRLRDDQNKKKATTGVGEANEPDASPIDSATDRATITSTTAYQKQGQIEPVFTHYESPHPTHSPDLSDLQIDPNLLQVAGGFDPTPSSTPTAVYIRPQPRSKVYSTTKMWLASLSGRSVDELRIILASKWPDAVAVRIDGVEKDASGREISYLIEEDEELDAYLDHVQGRKAVFSVLLERAEC